jgi:hypothetical protein
MHELLNRISETMIANVAHLSHLWIDKMGTEMAQTWNHPEEAVKAAISVAKRVLDRGKEWDSHVTLFFRHHVTDRLNVVYSTNNELTPGKDASAAYFSEKQANFDNKKLTAYYELGDRLQTEDLRRSDVVRVKRGLTGWVAVSGVPVLINSDPSPGVYEKILGEGDEIGRAYAKYGNPVWGNRISDFPTVDEDRKHWSKRFLAVPIKSVKLGSHNVHKVIGVVRYTCNPRRPPLTTLDQLFLEKVAHFIACIKNLERIKNLAEREIRFELEKLIFEKTGGISRFLGFVAEALQSELASLYVVVEAEHTPVLRLLDAHGTGGLIGDLRANGEIKDYSAKTGGLTWQLFAENRKDPLTCDPVVCEGRWSGLLTPVLYDGLFRNAGLGPFADGFKDSEKRRQLITSYGVKLMGMSIVSRNRVLGVLKVEFPNTIDDDLHYNYDDQQFLKRCVNVLKTDLRHYASLTSGECFRNGNKISKHLFARIMEQIGLFRFMGDPFDESPFWNAVNDFTQKHAESEDFSRPLTKEEESFFELLRDRLPDYLIHAIIAWSPHFHLLRFS